MGKRLVPISTTELLEGCIKSSQWNHSIIKDTLGTDNCCPLLIGVLITEVIMNRNYQLGTKIGVLNRGVLLAEVSAKGGATVIVTLFY
jgi:hypothetical protein